MTRIRSEYPPDVTAANLFTLKQSPPQTFDVWLGRWWRGALAIAVREVQVQQPEMGVYAFTLDVRWSDRREAMFPDFRLEATGTLQPTGDGAANIDLTRITHHANWRSWTPAMAAAGTVAIGLFPVLWRLQGLSFGTIFVGGYGLTILTLSGGAWLAYRRASGRAVRALLRQAAGLIEAPVSDWHDFMFPDEQKGQYYR